MNKPDNVLSSLRLRITGSCYERLGRICCSNRGDKKFLFGLCGKTELTQETGKDLVITLHSVLENPIDEPLLPKEVIAWFSRKKRNHQLMPVVFSQSTGEEKEITSIVLEAFSKANFNEGAIVHVDPDGGLSGAYFIQDSLHFIDTIMIVGPDIQVLPRKPIEQTMDPELSKRLEQSFGTKTQRILSTLKIGVVGVSGTGSPVAEMLYRLGVRELVLVDDGRIGKKNLGRIYNASQQDVEDNRLKVDVLVEAFQKYGLPTKVKRLAKNTFCPQTIQELAQCDVIFGCMDKHSGRSLLNRLCTFYVIPYFDLGVKLEADGLGGVSTVCGAVHYLIPGESSLLSRRVIKQATIEAEDLKRMNPESYDQLREEKYIKGVEEEKPAVITVNTMIASLALNDFLARVHPYRNNPNSEMQSIAVNLCEPCFITDGGYEPDEGLAGYVGLGDVQPLLLMPFLN